MRMIPLLFAAAMLGMPAVAVAQGAKVTSAPELARAIDRLKPGQWVWAPQVAPVGPVVIYVDLSRQVGIVYRNGIRIGATTISSGKQGHDTPTGVFTILQKDADHRSNKYNNAPMPFQQRLTWDGVALHAGGLPGYPESHGCVHLPYEFAKLLFGVTKLGITVVVEGHAADHVRTSPNSLLAAFDAKGKPVDMRPLDGAEYRWNPELSPTGALSIIVSKTSQRVVVLRDGVEIGRSAAQVNDPDPGTHVINLVMRGGKPAWLYVGLPGHAEDEGKALDEATINRVRVPRAFYQLVKAQLKPGATILVTNSAVEDGPLPKLTIMDAVAPTP